MHVADFCVTDTKSAIAVARALGRSYFIVRSPEEWQDRLIREGMIRLHDRHFYRDKESGLIILCGCGSASCTASLELYLKHEEEKANEMAK